VPDLPIETIKKQKPPLLSGLRRLSNDKTKTLTFQDRIIKARSGPALYSEFIRSICDKGLSGISHAFTWFEQGIQGVAGI